MQLIKKSILILILFNFLSLVAQEVKNLILENQNAQGEQKQAEPKKKENFFNRKKKKREKKVGEYFAKEFRDLTMDELEHNKNIDLKHNNRESAARYLERMISICKDQGKICELKLELANVYFEDNILDKATRCYRDFLRLYPGNPNSEFISYRLIAALYKQTNSCERDQSETRETIKLANEFLAKDTFVKYRDRVRWIVDQCYKKLLDSEIEIFNFYLGRKKIAAAEKRLEGIKEEYLNNPKNDQDKGLLSDLEEQLKALK